MAKRKQRPKRKAIQATKGEQICPHCSPSPKGIGSIYSTKILPETPSITFVTQHYKCDSCEKTWSVTSKVEIIKLTYRDAKGNRVIEPFEFPPEFRSLKSSSQK